MKCFYHNDPDGKVSAYLVRKYHEKHDNYGEEYIPMDYSKKIDISKIEEKEQIFIVDFSIPVEEMKELMEVTRDITWIDHHISAINKYKDFKDERYIEGIRFDGIAGCLLTYLWFKYPTHINDLKFNMHGVVDENYIRTLKISNQLPEYIKFTSDWDTFDLRFKETIPFIYAFNSYDFNPALDDDFNKFSFIVPTEFIEEGKSILRFTENKNKGMCEKYGFSMYLKGFKLFALNTNEKSSLTFKSVKDKGYDGFLAFTINKYEEYDCSIYSNSVHLDCSKIATELGGGGHKGAAGFITNNKEIFNFDEK